MIPASPYDRIWGAGLSASDPRIHDKANWPGKNKLGKVLEQVRSELLQFRSNNLESARKSTDSMPQPIEIQAQTSALKVGNTMSEPSPKARFERLDEWTVISHAPTGEPFKSKMSGSVFRGMNNLDEAVTYAVKVAEFFGANGLEQPVFVVGGPTSTTKCRFEVVDATSSYTVKFKIKSQPKIPAEHRLSPDFAESEATLKTHSVRRPSP